MLSRDDYEFVLLPWEYRGATFDARPDAVTSVEVAGRERIFLLKVKQNALFFREAGLGDEWTFALWNVLERSSADANHWVNQPFLIQWFEAEVRAGNFGRVVVWDDLGLYSGNFVFVLRADGSGLAREPWDDNGFVFRWQPPANLRSENAFDWPFGEFLAAVKALEDDQKLLQNFSERDVPDEARHEESLHWICGSREELEHLTRCAAYANNSLWIQENRLTFFYSSENLYGRASLQSIQPLMWYADIPENWRQLSALFLDYNTPVGETWEFNDMVGGRDSWDPLGHSVSVEVEAPTQHERLEAMLFLREWLRGKVSDEEADRLLSI